MDAGSTRLRLRVSPGGTRTAVIGRHGAGWKVRVTAPADGGRANEAVLRLLAETFALPQDAVTLVSGQRGRDKIVELSGVAPADVDLRLEAAAR